MFALDNCDRLHLYYILCTFIGSDITIVAHSRFVGISLEAAEELQTKHAVNCEVQ